VRTKRYFYGNTQLEGAAFEYLARPEQILKGRLIAAAVLAVYFVTTYYYPSLELVFWALFLAGLPWLVRRSLLFRARNSAYRNIRFDFAGSQREAVGVYLILPIFSVLTLGLLHPFNVYKRWMFYANNSRFGASPFALRISVKEFYVYYAIAIILVIGAVMFLGVVGFGSVSGLIANVQGEGNGETLESSAMIGVFVLLFLMTLTIGLLFHAFLKANITNIVFNNVSLDHVQFRSTLRTGWMFWIYLSNAIAIVLSVGMLIPWASVRMVRYRLHNIQLLATEDIDRFVAERQEQVTATGEEFGDLLGVEIGL
jgi:uncharacterized membrane protein YjgN (DUF898 family)